MDWKPIESAPKDGRRVLLYVPWREDEPDIISGYWSASVWVLPGAWIAEKNRSDTVEYPATHWQPLPLPPSERD